MALGGRGQSGGDCGGLGERFCPGVALVGAPENVSVRETADAPAVSRIFRSLYVYGVKHSLGRLVQVAQHDDKFADSRLVPALQQPGKGGGRGGPCLLERLLTPRRKANQYLAPILLAVGSGA